MQSSNKRKFMADRKPTPPPPPPPAYNIYKLNGINVPVPVSVPTISHSFNNTDDQLQNENGNGDRGGINGRVLIPTISHAYNNYVTDDQLQNENRNGGRIENINHDDDDDEVFRFNEETEDYFNSLPSGYRFVPTNVELINDYLIKKLGNLPLPTNKMLEFNLYKYSPEKISRKYPPTSEKEWYIFTPRDRRYCNGKRPSRAAGTGYWKATGADTPITHRSQLIGLRKSLVFYEGKPPNGEKTNWLMQEFRVNAEPRQKTSADDMRLDDYVLCKIYNNKKKQNNNDESPNNNELQTVREDGNCSRGYCQEQTVPYSLPINYDGNCSLGYCQEQTVPCQEQTIPYSLPINYETPTATVATPVSSMPVYSDTVGADAAASAATVVPDSTLTGDVLYLSSSQMFTDYKFDNYSCSDGILFDYKVDIFDLDELSNYQSNYDFNSDIGNDCSSPAKRKKKD